MISCMHIVVIIQYLFQYKSPVKDKQCLTLIISKYRMYCPFTVEENI